MKIIYTSILICLTFTVSINQPLFAQFQGKVFEQFNDAQVKVNGASINSSWCGGVNSIQINHADLNNDGKKDLVLYDHNSYVIKTFINTGNNGEINYTYDHRYEKNFPVIYNYLILKDYNCDGIPDLFHKGSSGVSIYKGSYLANELTFTYYKDLYFPGTFGPVNVYVQPDDIPAIEDVDNDGDIDVVAFGISGSLLEFTKNMQVELGLPCDSMRMVLADNCYGKFFQGFYRTANLGYSCKGISPGDNSSSDKKTRHTGNCIALIDIEGDGDLDIMGGNISYNDAQLLINSGTSAASIITSQDTLYNSSGTSVYMPTWAAPFHVDIDNDGDKDILFTSHNENVNSANYNVASFYKNIGTDANPSFIYQNDSLFTSDMMDVGSYSYPTFFDYDKDGKKDLFIGTEGYLDNLSGIQHSKLAYYKNTSTIGASSFELMTNDFLNLSVNNYHGIFPTFGDISGDGIHDLVFGHVNGSVSFFKNYATSNNIAPSFLNPIDSIPGVTVGRYSTPLVYDFNEDGRTDLLVGNESGKLAYYKDTSSTSQKKLALQTISLGNFKAGDINNVYGYCVPFIGKMDNTNKEFLLIGNIDGTVARYDSFINTMNTFVRIDSNYSQIKTLSRSVPAVADIDGDGKYEMIIGNKLGGLTYYKQVITIVEDINDYLFSNASIELYPNPSSDILHILFKSEMGNNKYSINFLDITGKNLMTKIVDNKLHESVNISSFANGMYFAEITIGKNKIVKKFVVAKN